MKSYVIPYRQVQGEYLVLVKVVKETPEPQLDQSKQYFTYSLLGGRSERWQRPEETAGREAKEESLDILSNDATTRSQLVLLMHDQVNDHYYYAHEITSDKYDKIDASYLTKKLLQYNKQQRSNYKGRFEQYQRDIAQRRGRGQGRGRGRGRGRGGQSAVSRKQLVEQGNYTEADFLVWISLKDIVKLDASNGTGYEYNRKWAQPIRGDEQTLMQQWFHDLNTAQGVNTVEKIWEKDKPALLELEKTLIP